MAREVIETGEAASGPISVTAHRAATSATTISSSRPTRDPAGRIDGVLCTALDVTERRLFDVRLAAMAGQVASAYHRFELALENSQISVFEQDRDLRYSFVHNPPPGTAAADFLDRTDAEVFAAADLRRLGPGQAARARDERAARPWSSSSRSRETSASSTSASSPRSTATGR